MRVLPEMSSPMPKRIAIDGHVIACTSECNDLSEFGYKASKLGTEQTYIAELIQIRFR